MRKTRQILPEMEVDLGPFGKHTLTFDEVHIEDSELSRAMSEQPSIYAWYASVEEELTRRLKLLKIDYDKWCGEYRLDVVKSSSTKLTVKDIDAMIESDEDGVKQRKEIVELDAKIGRVKSYLVALGMRHSVLLELSERERWGWSQYKEEKSDVDAEVIGGRYRAAKKGSKNGED